MPARAAPPELPGFRFTTFGGSTAGIEGVFGRIYNPPLHARATISCCRGVQNTYSLTQKNPTCICKSVFLCWRYLSSRAVARKVLSAKVSLTSVFGMGTGGPSPQSTPTSSRQIPYPSPRSKAKAQSFHCLSSQCKTGFALGFSIVQQKCGDPYRIRTDVNGVRGRCLNHLTNGPRCCIL